jgi:gliding motility-associated-like protein
MRPFHPFKRAGHRQKYFVGGCIALSFFLMIMPGWLFSQPTTGPSNFSVTNLDGNRFRVNWTRGNGAQILVVASASATFGGTGTPANGTDYTENAQFGLGQTVGAGNFVVYEGTGSNITVTGLVHSTTYYFRLFEFNGTGAATLYNTTGVLEGNGTTVSPPTVGSSSLTATPTGNSSSLTWTRGNGSRSLVILREGAVADDPVNYTNYSANSTFGSGAAIGSSRAVHFAATNTVNVTNLQPNTTYFYKVVEANGPSGPVYNFSNILSGSFTTGGAPTVPPTVFTVNNQDGNRLRANWVRGNGNQILVVASLSPTFGGAGLPTNGIDYTPNANFGSGPQLGTGNFVVFEGTGTNVTVTGLLHSTTYYFRLFEFNGTGTNTVYNTVDFLAGSGSTLFPPTLGSSSLVATPTGNTASLTWTRGNGSRSLVILQAGSAPGNPVDYTNYSASPTFGSGSAIGSGRVVHFSSSNTVNVTNLVPNTTYFFSVVEANGPSAPVFDLTRALTGSFTTEGAPTVGSSSFNASDFQGASFSFSFARGNGSRRLVVMRQDLPVAWTPTDGIDYNESSVFGAGDNLGGNTFVVADFTSSSVSVTGLTPATTYHVAVFEYNGTATNTVYLTVPAQVLRGSGSTLSPPGTSAGNPTFSAINGHRGTVAFTAGNGASRIVLARAGAPVTDVPVNLVNYWANASFPSAPALGASRIVYEGSGTSFTITALQPNTTYHFAVFEYNGSTGPVYKQVDPGVGSFTTEGLPTVFPSTLAFSGIQGDELTLSYTVGNGFGRMVIAKEGSPVDVFPPNFTSYTASTLFGAAAAHLGGGNYVIQNNGTIGGNTSTWVTGLSIGRTYHFAIIEYNGTGTERIYVTSAQSLTGSQATLSPPTVQAGNIIFSGTTATSTTISWTNGNGTARLVLVRPGAAVASLPVNLTTYSSWSSHFPSSGFVGTSRIVYNGSASTVTVTGMPPDQYHVAIVEYNGTTGPVYRTADPLTGMVLVGDRPDAPASNISFSSINGGSFTVGLTPGNGLSRMIVAKQGSPVDAWPVDNTGYTPGAFGSGSNLGGGNFVVAQGNSSSFHIGGLQPNTTYHLAVVEFNGTGASALYQLPALVATANRATLSAPTQGTSGFFGSAITGNRLTLSWTNGNGAGRLIIAKAGSPVDVTPANLTDYVAHTHFGSGSNFGGGNFAVFDGSGASIGLSNLQPGITYHFALFEYNGFGSGKVYLTTDVGRASFTTLPRPTIAPRNLNVSDVNGDRFTLSVTPGNGTRRLVVLRQGGLVNAVPADFTTYTPAAFGSGTQIGSGNFVTTLISTGGAFTVTGLQPNTQYGVAVFELDGAAGNERYLVTEYINQLVSTSSTPTIATFSLLYNSIGSNSVNLSWTNGNGQARMVVVRPFQPVTFSPVNLNTHGTASTNYASAGILAGDHRHIQRGANTTVNITNLTPGTTYHVAIFEYNGPTQPVYMQTPLRGFFTTLPASGLAIGGFDAITFCPAQQVDVPYFFTGVLNTGNQLSIELSDISGSFATPAVIGIQSTINTTGFITSTLPAALPEGIGYRLRVRSTNPAGLSADNGVDLQIATSVVPTVTVVGGQTTSCGTPIQLTTNQPLYNVQWFRNSAVIPGATTSSFFAGTSGNYQVRIAGASGGCQLFSTPTSLTITPRPAFNLQFDSLHCLGAVRDFAGQALPTGGTFAGPGISGTIFNTAVAGVGQHIVTYTYTDPVSLCSYSETKIIRVLDLPAAPATAGGSGCSNTNVTLTASGAQTGESYRWYSDAVGGVPIGGATTGSFNTPPLATTTNYYVSIFNGACESSRTAVTATINPSPAAPAATSAARCGDGTVTLTAGGGAAGQYRWYAVATGGSPLAGETNAAFTTPSLTATTTFYVSVNDGTCESDRTAVTASINPIPAAPAATGAARCGDGTVTLTASGGAAGQYRWYTAATGGLPLAGETNAAFTTPSLTATTTYHVAINDGTCESDRTAVTASINPIPAAPTTTGAARCGDGTVTLTASGGAAGQYRWYTAATGGSPLSGETNAAFTTPSLTATTTFYASVNNGTCESSRTAVVATVNPTPARPVISASGPLSFCSGQSVTLTAPAGFTYLWSNGATTQQITVTTAGSFTVVVSNASCTSAPSDPAVVTVNTCTTNQPPVITATSSQSPINGIATISLVSLLSDPDNNLDLSTLRIVTPPRSGAQAAIGPGGILTVNYQGLAFSGTDELTIEVCDVGGLCVQQRITIQVIGDILVYNGISPNGDGQNDVWVIEFINLVPDARDNEVRIFNRWGDVVWEGVNYDNTSVVFRGLNRNGNELPSGTYFYQIRFASPRDAVSGFLALRR